MADENQEDIFYQFDGEESDDGDSIVDLSLVDDPDSSGQARVPLGKGLFTNVVDGFSIKIRQTHAVHGSGTWDAKAGQHASLLIYKVKIVDDNPSRGRRFKNLHLQARFKSEKKQGLPKDDPYICCYAPAQQCLIGLLPTTVLRSKQASMSVSIDLDASPAPLTIGPEFGFDKSWDWKKEVWATLSGEAHERPAGRGRLGDNVVQWTLGENKYEKKIIDSCDVAILLRRPDASPFTVDFSGTKATVDWRYAVAHAANKLGDQLSSLIADSDQSKNSYTYDPNVQGPCPEGVAASELHLLEQGTKLEEYSFQHILNKVRGLEIRDSAAEAKEDN